MAESWETANFLIKGFVINPVSTKILLFRTYHTYPWELPILIILVKVHGLYTYLDNVDHETHGHQTILK